MVTYAAKNCAEALRAWRPGVISESPGYSDGDDASRAVVVGAERDLTGQSVLALRDQFVAVLEDVPDPDEQRNLIAIFYTQVRCQWTLRNIQSGYQISSGIINQSLYRQSGLLTELLAQLEPFVGYAEVARITRSVGGQTEDPLPEESVPTAGSGLPDLSLDLANLKKEVDAAQSEREILASEFGFSDANSVVAHNREMQSRLAALEDLQFMLGNLEDTVSLVNM
jgi:hypothetical protein